MKAEISRLAAQVIQDMPMAERNKFVPFIEKANFLKDIPQPWRDQMQAIKDGMAKPYEGSITEL